MIILDDEPRQGPKTHDHAAGVTLRFPERAAGRAANASALTLPDYETSQALAQDDEGHEKPGRRSAESRHRFWRATLYALIIYIFISLVIVIPILFVLRRKGQQQNSNPPPWRTGVNLGTPSDPSSLDNTTGAIPVCNSWTYDNEKENYAITHWSTTPNGQFSIRSNVTTESPQRIWGQLNISMNSNKTSQDAYLSISMQASSSAIIDATNVCFARTDDACDLALYVPSNLGNSDTLHFNITLLFPHAYAPSNINKLATLLPMFNQSVATMSENWTFSTASFQGDSSPFTASYLQANNLIVQTSSASISGNFYVNESLTLDTIDAPVNAAVTLVNDWTTSQPTYLAIDTGQGEINTKIHLIGPRPINQYAHTVFQTSLRTYNAPLSVSVMHDENTPPSQFYLTATNSIGKSYVSLDNKYEGTFNLQTKLASATIDMVSPQDTIADPSGSGGKRNYQCDLWSAAKRVGGGGGGNRPVSSAHQGNVGITSTHSPVILHLAGAGIIDDDDDP